VGEDYLTTFNVVRMKRTADNFAFGSFIEKLTLRSFGAPQNQCLNCIFNGQASDVCPFPTGQKLSAQIAGSAAFSAFPGH